MDSPTPPNPVTTLSHSSFRRAPVEDTLTDRYDAARLPDGAARTEFLAEHGDAVTAVVTSGRTGVDAALMDALPTSGRSSTSASVMTPPTWNAPPNWGSA